MHVYIFFKREMLDRLKLFIPPEGRPAPGGLYAGTLTPYVGF
jgi:hypothetical protein